MDGFKKQAQMMKLGILKARMTQANLAAMLFQQRFRPSLQYPVHVERDGERWVAILDNGYELPDAPHAYGDNPEYALRNFDALWTGCKEPFPCQSEGLSLSDRDFDLGGDYDEGDGDEDDGEEY